MKERERREKGKEREEQALGSETRRCIVSSFGFAFQHPTTGESSLHLVATPQPACFSLAGIESVFEVSSKRFKYMRAKQVRARHLSGGRGRGCQKQVVCLIPEREEEKDDDADKCARGLSKSLTGDPNVFPSPGASAGALVNRFFGG